MQKNTKPINYLKSIIPTVLRWLPAILIMTVIYTLSSVPSRQLPNFNAFDFFVKKGGHMVGYALLAIAYLVAVRRSATDTPFVLVLILVVAYASSDELHQSFVAGRHPSPVDVGIDFTGAAIGLFVFTRIQMRKIMKRGNTEALKE